jgi:20S proteasome subunit beta 1
MAEEIDMGTTIVAMRTRSGVVVGADTRTSSGSMVSNRYANKLSFLYQSGSTSCVLCRSGSAADTQFLADEARWEFRSRSLRYYEMAGSSSSNPSVEQMARWLRYVVMNGSYTASLICAGYDPQAGGRIFSISQTGSMVEEDIYATGGSGSTYIIGLLDHFLKTRNEKDGLMEEQEAIDFVSRLIHLAMERDGGSGGVARITILNENGSQELCIHPPRSLPPADNHQELIGFKPAAQSTWLSLSK